MMRNCYKREDIFVCRHDIHRSFDYRVSAYHVLHEKRCYPEGCIDFIWKCKLLGKGGSCPKGYHHVGNNCTNCRFYDEEKVHRRPELLISEDEYRDFQDECRFFDEWLEDHEGRLLDAGGRVTDIRPYLVKRVDGPRRSLSLRGFLLRLQPAYVGRDGFEDAIYIRISGAQQRRHRLAAGDALEVQGVLRFDRGRVAVTVPRRLYVEERMGNEPARWDRALLDKVGAVSLDGQPERCLQCERGILVDVEDAARPGPGRRRFGGPRREVLCLEGIGRPAECPFEALRALREGFHIV